MISLKNDEKIDLINKIINIIMCQKFDNKKQKNLLIIEKNTLFDTCLKKILQKVMLNGIYTLLKKFYNLDTEKKGLIVIQNEFDYYNSELEKIKELVQLCFKEKSNTLSLRKRKNESESDDFRIIKKKKIKLFTFYF